MKTRKGIIDLVYHANPIPDPLHHNITTLFSKLYRTMKTKHTTKTDKQLAALQSELERTRAERDRWSDRWKQLAESHDAALGKLANQASIISNLSQLAQLINGFSSAISNIVKQ